MAQKDQQHLCITRMQIRSLARHSGLKHPLLLQLWHRWQLWLRSDPWPGNSAHRGAAKKEKKKKLKQKAGEKVQRLPNSGDCSCQPF